MTVRLSQCLLLCVCVQKKASSCGASFFPERRLLVSAVDSVLFSQQKVHTLKKRSLRWYRVFSGKTDGECEAKPILFFAKTWELVSVHRILIPCWISIRPADGSGPFPRHGRPHADDHECARLLLSAPLENF
ncbi:UNVERIFIED_CONTAM: hypothetical protein HHA_451300 [Hammondia hammondi]|eukprot:XP_008884116.1 hypothetical protein HHA_451300 [Hammondia hammondi]